MRLTKANDIVQILRSSCSRLGVPLAAVLILTGGYLVIQTARDFRRIEDAIQADELLREFRVALQDAHYAARLTSDEEIPSGLLARIANDEGLRTRIMRARRLYREDAEAQSEIDSLVIAVANSLTAAAETVLARLQLDLSTAAEPEGRHADLEAALTGAASRLHSHLVDAQDHLFRLEARPRQGFEKSAAASHAAGILLAGAFAVSILSVFLVLRERRRRDRHLQGALLIDDMLEAYSRRLELMNAELEQLNAMKTQFLANTSHELLTPMNAIMGALEILREGGFNDPDEEREFLQDAHNSGEQLLGLIHDLLDLCRMEEGNLAVDCTPSGFAPILEQVVARHRPAARKRDLALMITPPHQGWPIVQADPERVAKVLDHLLSNSIKFTESGSIRVQGRLETEGDVRLYVEVLDTGVGIPQQKLRQVFELFRQADASHTRRFGGTGLGLTLSRHLILAMGGQIGIDSDGPGRGTRAWFTLPLAPAAQIPAPDQTRAA